MNLIIKNIVNFSKTRNDPPYLNSVGSHFYCENWSIKYKFYAPSLYIIIPLLVFGLFNIFIGNNTTPRFLKIFLNISVNLVFYQYVMQYYNYDIKLNRVKTICNMLIPGLEYKLQYII